VRFHPPYTFYRRRLSNGQRVYYYRFYDADGERTAGRSTGETNKALAHQVVVRLIQEGRLTHTREISFEEYAANWWGDQCPYVQGLQMRGKTLTRKYIANQRAYLDNHVLPTFKTMKLSAIRPSHIERWLQALRQSGMSGSAVNHCHSVLRIMLCEARRLELIPSNPIESVRPVSYTAPSRQILSLEEAKALLDETKVGEFWADEITYCASLLAATTGVRLGECQALRIEDIHDGYITVAHSWDSRYEGLKPTKTKRVREIPITAKTAKWLSRITAGRSCGFVFSLDGKRPLYYKVLTKALYEALGKIGITEDERRRRCLNFHSLRHFFNSTMRGKIPDAILRQLTGHSTEAMTEHYSHFRLEDFKPIVAIEESLGI
jgi:integrase